LACAFPAGFCGDDDAQGRVDVSPKGDPPGFVHVIDDTTIAIPERPGTKRVDGYLNVLERPHVGTLFLIPGRGDTLRINGTARILSDAEYFDAMAVQSRPPLLALEIDESSSEGLPESPPQAGGAPCFGGSVRQI
jgi:uncharacterized protein